MDLPTKKTTLAQKFQTYQLLSKAFKVPLQKSKSVLKLGAAFMIGIPISEGAIVYSGTQNLLIEDPNTCSDITANVVSQNIDGMGGVDVSWRNNGFGAPASYLQIQLQNAPGGLTINGLAGDNTIYNGNLYAYPRALTVNTVIGPAQPWALGNGFRNELVNAPIYNGTHWGNGKLNAGDQRFLGFRFDNAGTDNYGWMRIQYNNDCSILIIDWAYEDSGASISPLTTLPASLTQFSVQISNETANLLWTTESEFNNAGFEIQRSEKKTNFQTIAWVDGKGDSQDTNEYTYQDDLLTLGKTYYYRLKQVDYDGRFQYSQIVAVKIADDQNEFGELYPQPANLGLVHLSCKIKDATDLVVDIYDMQGQWMANWKNSLIKGEQIVEFDVSSLQNDVSSLQNGMYFLKIDDGIKPFYRRMVIQG